MIILCLSRLSVHLDSHDTSTHERQEIVPPASNPVSEVLQLQQKLQSAIPVASPVQVPSESSHTISQSQVTTDSGVAQDPELDMSKDYFWLRTGSGVRGQLQVAIGSRPAGEDLGLLQRLHNQPIPRGYGIFFFEGLKRQEDGTVALPFQYGDKLTLQDLEIGEPVAWPEAKSEVKPLSRSREISPEDARIKVVQMAAKNTNHPKQAAKPKRSATRTRPSKKA